MQRRCAAMSTRLARLAVGRAGSGAGVEGLVVACMQNEGCSELLWWAACPGKPSGGPGGFRS
jgi:hypothetical protein